MIKDIYKFKIPRDCAYVTKTSRIEAWIQDKEIATDIILYYGGSGDSVLSVHFYLPSSGIPYEHFLLSIGAVKREIVGAIRECLETDVFPALTSWMKQIEALDKTSTSYKNKQFNVQWKDDVIVITKD